MPAYLAIVLLLSLLGLYFPFTHLFWREIIEGQVGKQSFVAHMIESWMKHDLMGGFPTRYFAEPWHSGPGPWAEEVPLFHFLAAQLGALTHLNEVQSGRVLSFGFGFVLLASVYSIAKSLFESTPNSPTRARWLAPLILIWTPGFQIYSASVIPDLGMVALIAWAFAVRLGAMPPAASAITSRPKMAPYALLLIACLLKYFAVFALLALFIYDCIRSKQSTHSWADRARAFVYATLAGLPTLAYLYYFLSHHIPNPITEYMGSNGYGHLAGPFLFQLKFYLRFVTWVFVKNPTLILSGAAVLGFIQLRRASPPPSRPEGWLLIDLLFCAQVLFALVFASSFFVHDYYALPFLLPIVLYGCAFLSALKSQKIAGLILISIFTLGHALARDATFRLTNYVMAADQVRDYLFHVPDRDVQNLVVFSSDFSLPVIPILSKKAGWAFNAEQLDSQLADFHTRMADPRTRAFVFYAREPGASPLYESWLKADPKLASMRTIFDQSFSSEGRKGSATRLVIRIW